MTNGSQSPGPADLVEALIRAGGRREDPPVAAHDAVLAVAESVWRDKVRRRRRWRTGVVLAAAAAVAMLAVGLSRVAWQPAPARVEVARVDRLVGHVERRRAGSEAWTRVTAPDVALETGITVRTGPASGAGLLYRGNLSLRLGAESEVELVSPREVTLRRGTLYLATEHEGTGGLDVGTPVGRVRELGTQYELQYTVPKLRIRVREGGVRLTGNSGAATTATAGEQLSVSPSGTVERSVITAQDPDWRWVEGLAPMPNLEGKTARVLLEWAARETGRELHYTSTMTERRAAEVVLHGQLGRLSPRDALAVLAATTDLHCRLEGDDRITVDAR